MCNISPYNITTSDNFYFPVPMYYIWMLRNFTHYLKRDNFYTDYLDLKKTLTESKFGILNYWVY